MAPQHKKRKLQPKFQPKHENKWQEQFNNLKAFRKLNGHCKVPRTYPANPSLGIWVKTQRYENRLRLAGEKSRMTDERRSKLESIGFVWDALSDRGWPLNAKVVNDTTTTRDERWHEQFNNLKAFQKLNGHCKVPAKYPANPALGIWVAKQRHQNRLRLSEKLSRMTDERRSKLESIGFVWDASADGWQEQFNNLKAFQKLNGHCKVPSTYPANPALGIWVAKQRHLNKLRLSEKLSTMTDERRSKLNSIGFVWDASSDRDERWHEQFNNLKAFQKLNGHCKVPQDYPANPSLGIWVATQRHQNRLRLSEKLSTMTDERRSKLESIGFCWYRIPGAEFYEQNGIAYEERNGLLVNPELASANTNLDSVANATIPPACINPKVTETNVDEAWTVQDAIVTEEVHMSSTVDKAIVDAFTIPDSVTTDAWTDQDDQDDQTTNVVGSCEEVCPFKDKTLIQLFELGMKYHVNGIFLCFERKELIDKLRLANVCVASADDPVPLSSGVGTEEQEDLIADNIEAV